MSSSSLVAKVVNQRYLYRFLLFLCALTGFGQMPIYKRYYMADIPGFGWLADFYMTRFVHYLGASLLLALLAFALMDYLLKRRVLGPLNWSALVRVFFLAVIVLSGLFFVAKNLSGAHYPPAAIIAGNLIHLIAVMGLLAFSLYCLLFKKRWTERYESRTQRGFYHE